MTKEDEKVLQNYKSEFDRGELLARSQNWCNADLSFVFKLI